ncbi:hypothetical protein G6F63_015213 [Rhizopus arrhizus]|nr:hypothetical protein G6F63_015213 [Rhizopus arrhizus]
MIPRGKASASATPSMRTLLSVRSEASAPFSSHCRYRSSGSHGKLSGAMLLLVTPVASSARVNGTPATSRRSAVARSLARWPSHSGPFCLMVARISTWFHTLSKLDSDSGVSGKRGWPAACAN